jgi:hypothetical protein
MWQYLPVTSLTSDYVMRLVSLPLPKRLGASVMSLPFWRPEMLLKWLYVDVPRTFPLTKSFPFFRTLILYRVSAKTLLDFK